MPARLSRRNRVAGRVHPCVGRACTCTSRAGCGCKRGQDGTTGANQVHYLFADHLGSTNVTYNTATSTSTTQRYYPWGTVRPGPNNALPTGYTYTGQLDSGLGLMYYGARFYDGALGRFISPDTIVPDPGNPQALNRYSYVLNNPLRYTDPTGHNPACAAAMGGGPLAVVAALACEVVSAIASVGAQVQALVVNYGPQVAQGVQQAGNQIPALVDQLHQAASSTSSAPGASSASSGSGTSGSSGLDPNDPFFRRLMHQTGESDPIKAVAKASVEGPAKTGARSGVTVLGRYPAYVNTARRIDGNYLNFVDDSWDRLTDAQRWAVNKQFLDDAIARGDLFRLASLVDDAKAGTYFRKELEYLISLGYQVVGDVLVKVK